ncbi:hypothetical protein D9M69_125810 [compost metagenome]
MNKTLFVLLAAGWLGMHSMFAGAALPAQQAERLGTELTPLGALREGNAAGTIPAWQGGLPRDAAPVENGFVGDPFAADRPLFVITAANAEQYRDNLSPGQLAMLARYPDSYRIPVYPSHRSATVPEHIQAAARKSVTTVSTVSGGNALAGFAQSRYYAFPIPQNGLEVIWNHLTRYRGGSVKKVSAYVAPYANGSYSAVRMYDEIAFAETVGSVTGEQLDTVLFFYKQRVLSPARMAGNVVLVHETIDQVADPRRAWIYNAGQRRVRRAPQIAYDGPGQASDGQRVVDNHDLYNGAPDRYEWKLLGRRELYIPYNSFRLASPSLGYEQLFQAGHLNQEHTRYELHRVWEVEATLKPGQRHAYAKRRFFVDEDTWQIALADMYDGRGELWRVGEGHMIQYYHVQVPNYAGEVLYDLLNRRYIAIGFGNEESQGPEYGFTAKLADFSPSALRSEGLR